MGKLKQWFTSLLNKETEPIIDQRGGDQLVKQLEVDERVRNCAIFFLKTKNYPYKPDGQPVISYRPDTPMLLQGQVLKYGDKWYWEDKMAQGRN